MPVSAELLIVSMHEGCGHDGYCSGSLIEIMPPIVQSETQTVTLSSRPQMKVIYPRDRLFDEIVSSVEIIDMSGHFECHGSGYCGVRDQETEEFLRDHGRYRSSVICIVVLNVSGATTYSSDSSDGSGSGSDVDDDNGW